MLYEEAKKAHIRKIESNYYEEKLRDSRRKNEENRKKQKILKPECMPWENSRQGIVKHLFNEQMNVPVESVDAYMQFIPPGSRSGKHRHMSEEYIFVLEGKGYDLHWDVDFELADKYYWKVDKEPSRWEWEQGDSIYIPPNTVHQHFNLDPKKPLRFISATSRAVRYIGFDDLEQIEDAPEYKEMPIRPGTQDPYVPPNRWIGINVWSIARKSTYGLNDFIRPRALITFGEACSKSLKERIQANADVEMFSFYNAGESGPIASECIAHEGLHVNADQLILECLKNGESAEAGEQGVVVFTRLYGYTTPYIRYRLGDICTLSTRYCSCGSNLPLMESPIGRPDEVIRLPNGKVLSVSAIVNIILRPFDGIDQFRLIQESPYNFVLKLVFLERPGVGVLSDIRTRIVEALGKPVSLDIQIVDFIKEEKGSKYRRFISKIPNPDL